MFVKRVLLLTLLLTLFFSLSAMSLDFVALEARTALSGVFLLLDADEVIFSKQIGYKDHRQQLVFDEHTLFCIGSITKPMVAMTLQNLVDENQRVGEFLPQLTTLAPLTIASLVNHRTSLVRDLTDLGLVDSYEAISLSELVSLIDRKGMGQPGGRYAYSNANYQVLAKILEQRTGQSFAQAMESRLFLPLGMRESRALDEDIPEALAQGHSRNLQTLKPYHFSTLTGSGNVVVTVKDLVHFTQAVLNGYFGDPFTLWGWNRGTFFEKLYLEHTGHLASGHAACLRIYPREKQAVIILLNTIEPDITELADAMSASLFDMELPRCNHASSGDIEFSLLEGRYRSEDGQELTVENRHGVLTILGAGMSPIFLKHEKGASFSDPAHPLYTHRFVWETGEVRPRYFLEGLVQRKVFFPLP